VNAKEFRIPSDCCLCCFAVALELARPTLIPLRFMSLSGRFPDTHGSAPLEDSSVFIARPMAPKAHYSDD